MRLHYTRRTMIILTVLCMLPLAAAIVSALLAGLVGCELNEGVSQPCEVLGLDIGGILSTLFVSGWFALLTLPLLMALMAFWALLEGGSLWRKRHKDRKSEYKDAIDA